jgi:hypothetical protein
MNMERKRWIERFDIALCSHLLFLYSESVNFQKSRNELLKDAKRA